MRLSGRKARNRSAAAIILSTVAAWLWLVPIARGAQTTAAAELPSALSDKELWRLVEDFSEPNGYFQSDNLVGNERPLQYVIPSLVAAKRGGVYLGVAPDQNFTYIVALQPRMAFIVDIRRGNLLEHLMYKALIELSPSRADFVSRLFSRPRPEGLDDATPVVDLFKAYWPVEGSERLYRENLQAIRDRLTVTHGFPLSSEDLTGIEAIYQMFFQYGPSLSYSIGGNGRNMPTYADMQTSTDLNGEARAYLASEANYRFLKTFEEKNLLVPIVGDFAGPKALRAVGAYVAGHGTVIAAFYTSNVEQYLFRNAAASEFYENVATLPIDDRSVFIRSASGRNVMDPIGDLLKEFAAGRILGYTDVTGRGTIR